MAEYPVHARLAHHVVAFRVDLEVHVGVEVARRFAYGANVCRRVRVSHERRARCMLQRQAVERLGERRRTAVFSLDAGRAFARGLGHGGGAAEASAAGRDVDVGF
jgi:hypothetical protein